MVSTRHQQLLNRLAHIMENKFIQINEIAIAGTPQHFDRKYHHLPRPKKYGGSVPDLVGSDMNNKIHLGEAETDMGTDHMNAQLINFSNWAVSNAGVLHVIVPPNMNGQMRSRIQNMGLGSRLGVNIHVLS